jgi:hypothetical protein
MRLTTIALILTVLFSTACSRNRPPNLTPDATMAFDNGRIVNAADDVRDVGIIANSFNQVPFSTPITRRIVQAHSSLLVIIETRATGWQTQAQAVLTELLKNITGEANARLTPYVELTKALLARIGTREFDEALSAEVLASYRELLKRSAAVDAEWLASH